MSSQNDMQEIAFTRQTGPGEIKKVIIEYLYFSEVCIGEEFWDKDEFMKYTKTSPEEATIFSRDGQPYFTTTYAPDEIAKVVSVEIID